MAKLTGYIALFDEKGMLQQFSPGDEPPAWAVKKITNPGLWDAESSEEEAGPPPRAGKGSGEPAWRSYADSQGVDVSQAETRDDIINALSEAGVRVE